MQWPPDYHLHTPLCRHARGEPTAYARHALRLGLGEIGFSDHAPLPRDDFDAWRMRWDQLDNYVESVQRSRSDHPALTQRLALEVDYLPGIEDWIRDLSRRHPWDYLIGSVHYLAERWAIDDPAQLPRWSASDPYPIWSAYFERLTQAAGSGLFDIIGHADLPKKFGVRPQQDCAPLYEPFLAAAARHGVALELNTAGLHKPCREIYPGLEILQAARPLGIRIAFGSDAHAPEEVGRDFRAALDLARAAGYTHSLQFQRRQAAAIPLPV